MQPTEFAALEARDWDSFFAWASGENIGYRLHEVGDLMTDAEYWRYVGEGYVRPHFIFPHLKTWCELLGSDRPGSDLFMNEAERAAFARLPDPLTIHRGWNRASRNKHGLSYSLRLEAAERFTGYRSDPRTGAIWTRTVPKAHALGLLLDREEDEIVIRPRHRFGRGGKGHHAT